MREALNLVARGLRRRGVAADIDDDDNDNARPPPLTYAEKRLFAKAQSKAPLSHEFLELFVHKLVKVTCVCVCVGTRFVIFARCQSLLTIKHY
jgi:hypothetical protein